ncbi:cation-transporting P-type ATPase [Geoalkalibacter halelectricus]|uniref:Cation-transporting P-type ATPase n=1 Tax=Geoalkalibacter halelectricus TaxID=2847045 RepID=A0ABY5ZFB2_9BACT|nr:cation-transporting P-type ATPase [Geoalkalibacter halelectricus]MDO3377937.1 cation-transporting P-type ATPase [Geoalkalibacter halelectricus]UWZ77882.1 cation-transporting P-type ATPase [Geoalkalibacter halelectricus]
MSEAKTSSKSARVDWHALSDEDTLKKLSADLSGLNDSEAQKRLEEHGPNRLPPPAKRSALVRFFSHFHNLLIYVLLAAALITAALGHWLDCWVILAVVVINAFIGFVQEGKAEKALDSIRAMLSLQAYVERDGKRREISAEDLVPGDIVLLQAGDKVPADLRLLRVKDLRVDEAILTGESEQVSKNTDAVAEDAAVGDRFCMAYSGTVVTYGRATGVVVATGAHTEIGRISEMLSTVEAITTPLLRQMDTFARWLTGAILLLAALTFAFGFFFRDYSTSELFLAAVALMVAAIPEGLPAIITITLAIGVQRMAKRNAIIRRLPAVETLGAVTVICSDKTGTLTRNEMTVQAIASAADLFEVEGTGYDPHGAVNRKGQNVELDEEPLLGDLVRAGLLCNDSSLNQRDGQWQVQGDPTEGALLTLGNKVGLDLKTEQDQHPRTDVIPFESEHRFMATLHHDHEGQAVIYLKGAPERVLEMCDRQRRGEVDEDLDVDFWHRKGEELAGRGQRLLALACKKARQGQNELNFKDVEEGLTLLGLVGIIDPPRPEAVAAIKECRSAGIRVKMITGDHARTALAIGADMGIGDGEHAVRGKQIEEASEEQLRKWVREVDIFARSSPEHKLRLVKALRQEGEVTAMTGDGVNDAPALKGADVGVAMGVKGTEVSKEAAEMVLADDNFASIVHAVEEGRTVYDNIRKAITFILPTNGAQAFVLLAAIAFGQALVITPVQILWVNMITAVTLALALAFEPPEADIMERSPRPTREEILTPFLGWRIFNVSLILLVGTFGMFLYEVNRGAEIELARTVAVNTLVMFEVFYLFNCRYLHRSVLSGEGLLGNRYVLLAIGAVFVLQALFTYAPPMQVLFSTAPMDAATWLRAIAVAFSVFVLVELEKVVYNRLRRSD